MQYLELKDLSFHAYHGVMEQEKIVGNTYVVNLKLFFDFTKAMQSDDLDDTVNYALVYEIVKQEMNIHADLIEHLAFRIVNQIKNMFTQIEEIEIRLAKKNPPIGGDMDESAVVIRI